MYDIWNEWHLRRVRAREAMPPSPLPPATLQLHISGPLSLEVNLLQTDALTPTITLCHTNINICIYIYTRMHEYWICIDFLRICTFYKHFAQHITQFYVRYYDYYIIAINPFYPEAMYCAHETSLGNGRYISYVSCHFCSIARDSNHNNNNTNNINSRHAHIL